MTVAKLKLYEAFNQMLRVLDIEAKAVCDRSGVSQSRVSMFRTGKRTNMGSDNLDALLDAAESINPKAREVFANYIGGKGKPIEEMSLAEKGALMVSLSKSLQSSISTHSSISTDSKANKTT